MRPNCANRGLPVSAGFTSQKLGVLTANGDEAIPAKSLRKAMKDSNVQNYQEQIPRAIEQTLDDVSRVSVELPLTRYRLSFI